MKTGIMRWVIVFVLVFVLVSACASQALGEAYNASAMKLTKYKGEVTVVDDSGKNRLITEDELFSSGETLKTGKDSTVTVQLDDKKFVALDENTQVQFTQVSGYIELELIEGTVFVDVREKLGKNETFEIKTTSMTTGIRGTLVFLSEESSPNETGLITRMGVLEGTAQIDYEDQSGAHRLVPVPAGQIATISKPDESGSGVSPVIAEMTRQDVEGFISEQVLSDPALTQRVIDGSETGAMLINPSIAPDETASETENNNDFPAEGDWTWNGEVTLVAQSASKLYDGQPLTRPSDVLVYGLPQGFNIQVSANGSQISAGETENPVAGFSIYNGAGENVTNHFTNVKKVSGRLTVDPAPLIVWTGSAEKYYDGEPLTNPEAELRTVPGYQTDEPTWRNTSIVTRTALGSETMIAASGSIWVHSTNPLTGDTREIVLYTGQRLSVRLNSAEGGESIEFEIETQEINDLPEDILRLYADNPDLMAQACEDAGWDPLELAERIAQLPERTEGTVQKNGLKVSRSASNDLMADSADIRITIDTEITNYNSRPLTGDEAHYTSLTIDPSIVITATGSQTEVGESVNTYEIEWGNANPGNYVLSEDLGTLTVLPTVENEITITANSAEKVYDGKALKADGFSVSGLPAGYTVRATVEGSRTNAGTGSNDITGYRILDADGNDVTTQFTNVKMVNGTLTVTPAPLKVTTGSASKVYDGKALTSAEATITGFVNGETATIAASGSITQPGKVNNSYKIDWGKTTSGNYTLKESLGTLTVEKLELAIDLGSVNTEYTGSAVIPEPTLTYTNGTHAGEAVSGTRMRASDVLFRFQLFTGDSVDLTVSGMGADAGSYTLKTGVTFSEGAKDRYVVSVTGTSVTVIPAELTVTTGSASKEFDGEPLTCNEVTVDGLVAADEDMVSATATGTITEVGMTENTYTIDWGSVNKDNYTITEDLGTLEVIWSYASEITITAGSFSHEYQPGYSGKCDTYEVTGLPDGYTLDVTIEGYQYVAGTSDNVIATYTIKDSDGEDVTENFTNVTLVNGRLTVTKAKIRVWSYGGGSFFDSFDTCEYKGSYYSWNVSWQGVYLSDDPRTTDLMITDKYGDGWVKDVGTHTLSFTATLIREDLRDKYEIGEVIFGTLTVTPASLTVTTESAEKTYDGTPLTAGANISGLVGDDGSAGATVSATGSITDAGSTANTYTIDWGSVNQKNYTLIEELGTLKVNQAPLTVITGSDTKLYDGEPLTCSIAKLEGLVSATDASVEAVGEITEPGETVNTYKIEWNGSSPNMESNYTLIEQLGILSVTENDEKIPLYVRTYSDSKVYDGTPLSAGGYLAGLLQGDSATLEDFTEITDAGSTENCCGIKWGSDTVSDKYKVIEEYGTLTVNRAPLTLKTGSADKSYDGKELICSEGSFEGFQNGETVTLVLTGTITDAGSTQNSYNIDWGSVNADNYILEIQYGTLTVTPATLEVYTGSAGKEYDTMPLTCDEASLNGLQNGETATVKATGSITEIGYIQNTYEITWGTAKASNYNIVEDLGWLEVYEPFEEEEGEMMLGSSADSDDADDIEEEEAEEPEDELIDEGEGGRKASPPDDTSGKAEGDETIREDENGQKKEVSLEADEADKETETQPEDDKKPEPVEEDTDKIDETQTEGVKEAEPKDNKADDKHEAQPTGEKKPKPEEEDADKITEAQPSGEKKPEPEKKEDVLESEAQLEDKTDDKPKPDKTEATPEPSHKDGEESGQKESKTDLTSETSHKDGEESTQKESKPETPRKDQAVPVPEEDKDEVTAETPDEREEDAEE